MCGLLFVNLRCRVEDHVAEFVRKRETLPLAPILAVHDDYRRNSPVFTAHPRREPVDIGETHPEDLDPALLQEIDKVRYRIEAETPVGTHAERGLFRFGRVPQHRPRSLTRHVPSDGGKTKDLLYCEIPLQHV